MAVSEKLKRTPLYDEHLALEARMVPFGGWEMPVQYEGILSEHKATRQECGLFDISHMGEFMIEGDLGTSGLDKIVTMNLSDCPVHSCRYGCILNEDGGLLDDTIIFRLEPNKWFVVVNGATTNKDALHFQKYLSDKASFEDLTFKTGKLDIQGPLSRKILSNFVDEIKKLDYYNFDFFQLLGEKVLISRTGYTGELGYEIYYPWEKTVDLWKQLINNEQIKPAGLGARDILRLEVGYSLYGHELNEGRSALESGLERFIDFQKDFIGKDVLVKEKEAGVKNKMIGLQSTSRRSPREQHTIYAADGKKIGVVTSGTFSPQVNCGIGLGLVEASQAQLGKTIYFGNEKVKEEALITSKTFYKKGSLKN